MSEHITTERLNDYVDGLLGGPELAAVEAHLDGCAACAAAVAELSEVVSGLAALPRDADPARDLWPSIRARISPQGVGGGGGGGETRVIALPSRERGIQRPSRWRRRVSLTLPQLSAAAILVALLSAGSVWWALAGSAPAPRAAEAPELRPRSETPFARPAALPLEAAVSELEIALEAGRGLLDPETLRVIDESLGAIDQAIREAREALAADPASDLLNRFLINHQRAKLRVLQQATAGLIRT